MLNDVLSQYQTKLSLPEIDAVRRPRMAALSRPFWARTQELLSNLVTGTSIVALDEPAVRIGSDAELTTEQHDQLNELIETLIPWRKGPFQLFGHEIDSEWRSDMKWDRIAPHLGPLGGKRVGDFGCSNGYYLFRLLGAARRAGEEPECLLGFDPSERFYFAFEIFRRFINHPRLSSDLLGIEQAPYFKNFFDLVLCMGVIYHQRDPHAMLRSLHHCLHPGGKLVLESQVIPGDGRDALVPRDRYAKARNVYFIPTVSCLSAWAEQAGFSARTVSVETVTSAEQRRTTLAPYESLSDFLDPVDSSKTIEGYPAPCRAVVICEKRGERKREI